MILRESTWLAVAGIAVGVAAALGLMRLTKAMLYGIQPNDPLTMASGVLILLLSLWRRAGFLRAAPPGYSRWKRCGTSEAGNRE